MLFPAAVIVAMMMTTAQVLPKGQADLDILSLSLMKTTTTSAYVKP